MPGKAQSSGSKRQKRPGGRTAEVTRRINASIISLLSEGGLEACTFQNIAARAGIDRSTLYRRSPERWPAIVDALIAHLRGAVAVPPSGPFRDQLAAVLERLCQLLDGPLGPSLVEIAALLRSGIAPGEADRLWESQRVELAPMFDAAVARGDLAADVDRDELFAMAAGPICFRRLVTAEPVTGGWIRTIADQVCDQYSRKG